MRIVNITFKPILRDQNEMYESKYESDRAVVQGLVLG